MPAARVLLSLSILLLGAAGIWLYVATRPASGDGTGVLVVDRRAVLEELLRKRAGDVDLAQVFAGDPLGRLPLDEGLAFQFYPALQESNRNTYDPLAYFVSTPNFSASRRFREHPSGQWEVASDAHGFRRPGRISDRRPDLRILVAGDSHVEGVVPVEETLTQRLEDLLREERPGRTVEVLNAARGGYDFYNYLGVLERNLHLEPHVFVMIVYGGNDFAGFLPLHLYFRGLELPEADEGWGNDLLLGQRFYGQGVSQGYHQVGYFARAPAALELALEGSVEIVLATARLCEQQGIRFLCAYLPPIADVEREAVREGLELLEGIFALTPEDIASTDRLADRFLEALATHDVETLDLRPALRATKPPVYWRVDHHLSTHGHETAARALFEALTAPR